MSDKFIVLLLESNTVIPVYDIFYYNADNSCLMFDRFYLPDVFAIISLLLTYPHSLSTPFIKMHIVLLIIRFLCVISTSGYSSLRYAYNRDERGLMNNLHNDLIVSGHAMYKTLCLMFIVNNCSVLYSIICMPIIIFGILTNLFVGDHYTSDVILGVSLAILIYL